MCPEIYPFLQSLLFCWCIIVCSSFWLFFLCQRYLLLCSLFHFWFYWFFKNFILLYCVFKIKFVLKYLFCLFSWTTNSLFHWYYALFFWSQFGFLPNFDYFLFWLFWNYLTIMFLDPSRVCLASLSGALVVA